MLKFIYVVTMALALVCFTTKVHAEPGSPLTSPEPTPKPYSEPFQSNVYDWCTDLTDFVRRMNAQGGVLKGTGITTGGQVSFILFPDMSYGLFIYNYEDTVCLITTGFVIEPVVGQAI